ncbi:MAG TPA: histone deacetylase [Solirubrobacterales bacterium]|nr:histone deacetylase [Solirubrobacterales bacterium]
MSRSTGLVLLPEQALHDTGAHPENSRRIPPVLDRLRSSDEWAGFRLIEAREAAIEDILRAHAPSQIELVRSAAEAGPTWIDGDTPVSRASYEVALKAAGAAMAAVDEVVSEESGSADSLFALIRPPGHHATPDRAMGFCLFNNAAVAARYAAERFGLERVAVLDWDVHHGNGTQDILWRDPGALFISLHQWPLYPGSGWIDEVGAGEGEGFTVNLPMPPESGDLEYLEAMDAVVEPILEAYDPELLIVSAGQDAHAADQLANQMISTRGYNRMAERAAEFAARHSIGLVALHEGGYNLDTLPRLDHAIVAGFGGFGIDLGDPIDGMTVPNREWPERLEQIKRVQRKYWPGL